MKKIPNLHQTSVGVFREGSRNQISGVIRRGDMLWCDIGFTAYNLHTDTQHVGYVLKENETDVPAGLKEGLRKANIMQVRLNFFSIFPFPLSSFQQTNKQIQIRIF